MGIDARLDNGRTASSRSPSASAGHSFWAPAALRVIARSIAVTTGETERAAQALAKTSTQSFLASVAIGCTATASSVDVPGLEGIVRPLMRERTADRMGPSEPRFMLAADSPLDFLACSRRQRRRFQDGCLYDAWPRSTRYDRALSDTLPLASLANLRTLRPTTLCGSPPSK